MDNIGIFIGIGVAVAMAAYFRKKSGPDLPVRQRVLQGLLVMVAAGLAAGAAAFATSYLLARKGGPGEVDKAIAAARDVPLVGLVLQEHPEEEQKLRAVVADQIKNPGRQPSASVAFGADLRQRFIIPILRNADDDVALKAAAGMETLVRHLQATNVALCREFGLNGLRDPKQLNAEGTALFKQALARQEDAYRNGKTATPKPAVKDAQLGELLVAAGYTPKDLEQLNDFDKLSVTDGCAATAKLYAAPRALPARSGGMLARWLLTITQ